MSQPAPSGQLGKILAQVTPVLGFMKVLREGLEETVIIGHVTVLQRVNENSSPARIQNARELLENSPSHIRRQFMKHEYVRHDVKTGIGEWHCLALCDEQF